MEAPEENKISSIKEITVQDFHQLQTQSADFQLIDVRQPYEYDIVHLNGELIPLASILEYKDKIATDKQVIIHCRSGKRSADAIQQLQENFGLNNLYNLKGGILAYAREIDNTLPTY